MTNQELQSLKNKYDIIGNDPALNRALEVAVKVAPIDMTVLVIGESDPASVSAAVAKLKADGKTVLVQKSDAGSERCRTALKLSANGTLEVI